MFEMFFGSRMETHSGKGLARLRAAAEKPAQKGSFYIFDCSQLPAYAIIADEKNHGCAQAASGRGWRVTGMLQTGDERIKQQKGMHL